MQSNLITIPKLADELGLSRVAVYKKVKSGQIPARRVGRIYVISATTAKGLSQPTIKPPDLEWIDGAVKRVVRQYGTVLKWLSAE